MSREDVSWIPKISEEYLQELVARIKPVINDDDRGKCYIEPVDPRTIAYMWDPKPTEEAKGLKPLCRIRTYHTWAYYGLFKPSIAEVLAQIPNEHIDDVVAFEMVEYPKTTSDLNRESDALDAGYHVATVQLYVKA